MISESEFETTSGQEVKRQQQQQQVSLFSSCLDNARRELLALTC